MSTADADAEPVAELKPAAAPQVKKHRRNRRTSISAECIDESQNQNFVPPLIPKSEEELARIKKAVADNFLFGSLSEEDMRQVCGAMVEKKALEGEKVIEQGGAGDYFYVLDQGSADVYVNGDKVHSYASGSAFGELALMYNCPRAATVQVSSPSILWALDRKTFQHILYANTNRKKSKYESFLKGCELFENLSAVEVAKIVDVLAEHKFKQGDVILKEGDEDFDAMKFYVVSEGECEAVKASQDAAEEPTVVVVGNIQPGGFFGEKALIEREPRAASVIAKTDVQCVSLDVAAFERLLGSCKDVMRRKIDSYKQPQGSGLNAVRALTPSIASDENGDAAAPAATNEETATVPAKEEVCAEESADPPVEQTEETAALTEEASSS